MESSFAAEVQSQVLEFSTFREPLTNTEGAGPGQTDRATGFPRSCHLTTARTRAAPDVAPWAHAAVQLAFGPAQSGPRADPIEEL